MRESDQAIRLPLNGGTNKVAIKQTLMATNQGTVCMQGGNGNYAKKNLCEQTFELWL